MEDRRPRDERPTPAPGPPAPGPNPASGSPPPGPAPTPRVRITVADALALPVLRRGLPEVAAGRELLGRPIRWVHAGEVPNIASLLTGGELLLTTGMGLGARAAEQRRFVSELTDRGIAALVIELGPVFAELPGALVQAASDQELPLVALRREVPFVAVTEAIHTEIVNAQYALLRRGDELQHELMHVLLNGGGIPEVLRVVADRLGNPVFLEDPAGRLLFHATPASSDDAALDALGAWEATRSAAGGGGPRRVGEPAGVRRVGEPAKRGGRAAGRGGRAASGRAGTADAGVAEPVVPGTWRPGFEQPVAMHGGGGHGRLLALPLAQPLDETATVPLTRAADVLALSLLRARQEEELLARERGNVLAELAGGRLPAADAARRARAMGFTPGPALLPVAAELTVPADVAAAWDVVVADAQDALERRGHPALLGTRGAAKALLGLVGVHGAASSHRAAAADAAAQEIRAAVERRLGAGVEVVVVAGETSGWDAVAPALAQTTEAAASGVGLPAAPWHDLRALELRRLLWRWREDPELAAFVQRTLGPLVEHDRRRAHQLTATLEALVANGGRKAETARALHLNRQALYNRIARIEELLRTDLSDPDQLLTIQLALVARAVLR